MSISTGQRPSATIYRVAPDDETMEARWTRIGRAYVHEDGKGLELTIDLPILISRDTKLIILNTAPDHDQQGV
jgi:hypothetical protein